MFVKNFFQVFSNFFRSACRTRCRPDAFYHTHFHLSRTFFGSFQRIFTLHFEPNSSVFSEVLSKLHRFSGCFVRLALEDLHILSHHQPFVNTFFHLFSRLLILFKNGIKTHKNALKMLKNQPDGCCKSTTNAATVPTARTPAFFRHNPLLSAISPAH